MEKLNGNNLSRVKVANQCAIREIIYHFGPISRGEISERLALTLPTITTTINALLAKGVICEVAGGVPPQKAMGRRASLIDVAVDARLFLGVEIRGACRSVCITNYRGQVFARAMDDTPCANYEDGMETALRMVRDLLRDNLSLSQISGIGVCSPGLLDRENGILVMHPGYRWKNKTIRQDVIDGLGYAGPVVVDNNVCARVCALRLFQQDKLKNADTFTYMFVSQGIGCHLVSNNIGSQKIYTGNGEVGHMVMKPYGPLCSCGNRGCLEAFSSERAIIARCREALSEDKAPVLREICANPVAPAISEILEAQARGDYDVVKILDNAILYLGIATANIYNFVAPQRMVIDCALFEKEENRAKLMESIHSNLYTDTITDVHFTFMEQDSYRGAIGAAALAIQNDLQSYIPTGG